MLKRILYTLLPIAAMVFVDQITKKIAEQTLIYGETHSFLGDMFRLVLIENHGAFLGFGSEFPDWLRHGVFTLLGTIFIFGTIVWLMVSQKVSFNDRIVLTLISAGGVGNLTDRILNEGGVIDFLNLGIGTLRTGIFNVADIYLSAAFVLFVIHMLVAMKEERNREASASH